MKTYFEVVKENWVILAFGLTSGLLLGTSFGMLNEGAFFWSLFQASLGAVPAMLLCSLLMFLTFRKGRK